MPAKKGGNGVIKEQEESSAPEDGRKEEDDTTNTMTTGDEENDNNNKGKDGAATATAMEVEETVEKPLPSPLAPPASVDSSSAPAASAASASSATSSSSAAGATIQTTKKTAQPRVLPSEGLTFRVLYGAKEEEPMCYLLKVGEATILLDCGWDHMLDESLLQPLLQVVGTINLVLISFPDLTHMGALPWLVRHLRPGVPIYSTHPVFKMGQMILYDLYLSKCMETGSCPAFSLDDVDAAMARFQLLKFSQPLEVRQQGRFYLSVTPYPAGRVLGGAFWQINYKKAEEILYAVDFNLKSERHIAGAIEAFNALSADKEQRPSLAIVDARPAAPVPVDERKIEGEFLETVTATLRKGGNVLIPVEASGRVQELLLALNGHWRSDRLLWGYKIVLLHHMARNVLHFTKSMVEWMHPEVIKEFDRSLRNPFTLKHVVAAQSMLELEAAAGEYKNPLVILASDEGLDGGFSRALATRWASGAENALLLCGHLRKGSLAESFWKLRHFPKAALSFSVPVIERIVGEELAGLREKEEREKRKALELEEFRRQAKELMEGTVGAALDEERENHLAVVDSMISSNINNIHGSPAAANGSNRVNKRRRKSAAMYRRPLYLVFGCRDAARVEMDAYGEPLAEGECVDPSKAAAQEHRGRLQLDSGGAGGSGAGFVQRWGYLDDILMTEAQAQSRAGTNALKFVMKESMVEVRWKVKSFNLEGRTDGKNLRAILSNLAPRRLILVHGNAEAFGDLKRYASKMLGGSSKVSIPKDPLPSTLQPQAETTAAASATTVGGGTEEKKGEDDEARRREEAEAALAASMVQLQFDTKVLDVGLQEDGRGPAGGPNLALKEMGHYRLALVRARASDVRDADGHPLLQCEPASGEVRPPLLLADGDVLLTETSQRQSLRQKLREAGVNPEFQVGPEGAALVCDGTTIVRVKDNRVSLEGPLSDTYFKVRNVLYSRFVAL